MNTTLWDWIVVLLGLCTPALLLTVALHVVERTAERRKWRRYGIVPPHERNRLL
jgi:hypothetical protein